MTERQALVKAMLAEPADDLPRLVFADWLDENGHPDRAAFTRLQVEGMRQTGDDRERLLGEAAAILDRRYDDWVGSVNRYVRLNDHRESRIEQLRRQPFWRGVLGDLRVPEDEFLRPEVQELLTAWAADNGVERLTLTRDAYPSVRASWSKLGTLASVLVNTIRGKYAGGERPVLEETASPVLASVAALSLTGPTADDQGLHDLAVSPHVGVLSGLTLNDPHCTDVGLDALARARHLPNLRELRLQADRRVRFTAEGVLKVVASDRLPKFASLALTAEQPVRFDLARVLHHPAAGRLTTLTSDSADALQVVARSRYLTRLEFLMVSGHRVVVDSAAVSELLANPALAGLRNLVLPFLAPANLRLTPDDHARLRDRFGDGFEVGTG